MLRRYAPIACLFLLTACSSRTTEPRSMFARLDAGPVDAIDASTPLDGGLPMKDAGGPEDAGAADAGKRDAGMMGGIDAGGGGRRDAGPPPPCTTTDLGSAAGLAVATGTTAGRSSAVTPSCGYGGGPDVAYRWAAPHDGTFTFTTNGSDFDTVLSLRSGSMCAGPELGCDDDGGESVRSRLDATLASGDEVVIVVEGYGGDTGTYTLAIVEGAPATETACTDGMDEDLDGDADCDDYDCNTDPACIEGDCANGTDDDGDGDVDCVDYDCASSTACGETMCSGGTDDDADGRTDCADSECTCDAACLGSDPCPTSDLGSALGAALATGTNAGLCSYRTGSCGGNGGGVTFRWTAPSAGTFTFDTIGSDYDTVLYALDRSCGGTELACDDDTHGLQSEITVTAAAGQVIVIALDAYGTYSTGNYILNVSTP